MIYSINKSLILESASARGAEYDDYFNKMLKKCKYNSIKDMPTDVKKKFLTDVDAGWNTPKESGKDGLT